MRTLPIAVAMLVALAVVPAGVAGDVTGNPVLSATVADGTVTPGEDTAMQLTIVNTGHVDEGSAQNPGLNQRVTTARGLTVEVNPGDAPISVRGGGERAIGTLPEGSTPPIAIPISVDEDASQGTYEVPVEVNYTYTESVERDGTQIEENVSRTLNVSLRVDDAASFEVVSVSDNARVGATGDLDVTVRNDGSQTATDATVTLTSLSGDLALGQSASTSRVAGTLEPGEERTLRYRVATAPSATPQDYALQAQVTYDDAYGIPSKSGTMPFSVRPEPRQTFSVVATDSNVSVGAEGAVAVTMQNDGPIPVEDAVVSLTSTTADLRFGGTAEASRFVGTWAPGESRTVVFDVTAAPGAATRSYTMRAQVSYEDEGGDAGAAPTSAIGVTPLPEQRTFAFGGVSSSLEVGADGTLSGTITNTGDESAGSVAVAVPGSPGSVTLLEGESPVGDLDPGESADFSFPVEVSSSGEPGPKQFELVATYRNAEGDKRTSDTVDVTAEVAPETDTFGVSTGANGVTAGEGTTLTLTVTNEDDQPVTDVSAKLFANAPISTTDSEAFVKRLGPGESAELTFGVAASGGALAKDYPVEMDFQYDEPDGDTVISRTYRLAVSVAEPEDDGGGLPLPAPVLAVVVLVVLAAIGYYGYDRYGG